MRNSKGRQGFKSKSSHMTAGTSKGFHAVTFIINMLVIKSYGQRRTIGLEIFTMDSTACLTVGIFHSPK
jgi:hypothetical protein